MEYTSSVFSRLEQLFQTEGWRKRLPLPGSESQVNWDILTSYPEEFPVKKKEHLMRSHTDLGYIPSLNGSVQSSRSVMPDSLQLHEQTTAPQASLSSSNSQSLPKLTSIESVMPSSHLSLCCPLLILPPIPPSIRVFPMSQLFA